MIHGVLQLVETAISPASFVLPYTEWIRLPVDRPWVVTIAVEHEIGRWLHDSTP